MKGFGHFATNIKPITGLFHTIQKGPLIAIAVTGSLVALFAVLRFAFDLMRNNHRINIGIPEDVKGNNWTKNSKGEPLGVLRQTFNHDKKTLAVLATGIMATVGAGLALAKFDKAVVAINLFSVVGLILMLGAIVSLVCKFIEPIGVLLDNLLDGAWKFITFKSCANANFGAALSNS